MTPTPWTLLNGGDNGDTAIVVPEGTSPIDALRALVEESYGGEFSPANPVLLAEAASLKVTPWRECSPAQMEADGIDEEEWVGWWAPHGCGSEVIYVLNYDGAAYDLGERAEAAEVGRT